MFAARLENAVDRHSVRLGAWLLRRTRGRIPAWYLTLTADPRATVEVDGRTLQVRAVPMTPEEAAAWWPRVLDAAPDYARYPKRTDRRLPLVRLVPDPSRGAGATGPPAP